MPRAHSRQEEIPLAEPAPPWRAKGIFTDHIIKTKLPGSRLWPNLDATESIRLYCADIWNHKYLALAKYGRESHTREELLNKVLLKLGFTFLPDTALPTKDKTKVPDYVLYPDEETKSAVFESGFAQPYRSAIALLEAKKVEHPLDSASKKDTPGRFPHQQVRDYLQYAGDLQTGKPFFNWAILTNGNLWRLYCRSATPDDYFEFNFEKSLASPENFEVFVALFSPAAFIPDSEGRCGLDELRDDALQYQTELEDDLRERVFNILEDLANGFYARPENHITAGQLGDLYQNCLILLYRLLFVLYAEGRGLLPVRPYGAGHNKHYCERFSLARLLPRLRDATRLYNDDAFAKLYEEMLDLFRLINGDEASLNRKCNVPQYNGGLFDSELHPKLRQWRVGERTLAEALRGLMFGRIPGRKGESSRFDFGETIDYAELEVRQLGTIYEGLLENHLELKDARLVLVGDKAERKATGTYYTPDYIVRYIVDHTLGPLCQRIEESADVQKAIKQGKKDNSFANAILELKVLDPAMGSGHFLVRATEYLADKILNHQTSAIPVPEVSPGLSQAAAVLAHWRRRVVERCIFGVDLNPLAVELSKLSLWLTSIATDQPLSFLDHHLRPGNSLIGARLNEMGSLPRRENEPVLDGWTAPNLQTAVSHALAALSQIEGMESKDIKLLKEKETRWTTDVLSKLAPYRKVADLWVSTYFGLPLDDSKYAQLAEMHGADEKPQTKAAKALIRTTDEALDRLCKAYAFFHWDMEFPEVFFDATGKPKSNPGFDAVIGNPPYERIQTIKRCDPSIADHLRSRYASASKGNYDIYVVFVEKGLSLLSREGTLGFILPHKFFNSQYGEPLRGLIASGKHLSHVVHFGAQQVFEGATTYTCLMFLAKAPLLQFRLVKVGDIDLWRHSGAAEQGQVSAKTITPAAWSFAVGPSGALLGRLGELPARLGSIADIFVGLQTSADDVFILDALSRSGRQMRLQSKSLGNEVVMESDLLHPIVSGTDVLRYGGLTERQYVLFPYAARGENFELIDFAQVERTLPLTAKYLQANRRRLEDRERGKAKGPRWYGYIYLKNLARQSIRKLCVPRLVEQLHLAYDMDGSHFLDNVDVCGITLKPGMENLGLQFLLGLLNSTLARWYFPHVSAPFRGGWMSANKQFLSQLPIRTIDFKNRADVARHDKMIALVERTLKLHRDLREAWPDSDKDSISCDIEATDREIDAIVYDLYGLTDDEIAIVEGRTK